MYSMGIYILRGRITLNCLKSNWYWPLQCTFDQISYPNSLKVTFGFEIISLIDISLLPRLSQIRLASPKTVTRTIYSLLRCIEFSLLIKWGASTRQSSSLYCPMRNSDQFTIGKTHSTLICLLISMLVTDVGDEFEM